MGAIKFGISNAYYAKATDDGEGNLTYATPKPLKGAVALSLSASGETVDEYADNIKWFSAVSNNGYTGTLELKQIPDEFREDILNEIADKNGVMFENSDAVSAEFALLFQFEIKGDDAVNGKRSCLYRCTASRPDVSGQTKEANFAGQNETLQITAMPRANDHIVKASVTSDKATQYNGWFSAVYEKAAD